LRSLLAEIKPGDKQKRTRLRFAIDRLLAWKPEVVLAYPYGKPVTALDVKGAVGGGNTINIALLPEGFGQEDIRALLEHVRS
jgi:hypothetical protein